MLESKGLSWSNLEQWLNWDEIPRTKDGWRNTKPKTYYREDDTAYESIDGFYYNLENGTIQVLGTVASRPDRALVYKSDIETVLSLGISSTFFSLDQLEDKLHANPLQKTTYFPESLDGTEFLLTLFHADYLLKMFTVGVEISSKPPFLMQDTSNLLKVPKATCFMKLLSIFRIYHLTLLKFCHH
jgi:hypothetical protein